MGGKSSSSSSTDQSTTNYVTDRRVVADNGALVVGEHATGNTFTDHGAINGAFGVAGRAAEIATAAVVGATSIASKASESAGKQSTDALAAVAKAYEGAQEHAQGNRTMAYVGLSIAAVLALGLIEKRKAKNA